MAVAPLNQSFYADPASLNGLKRQAATQSPEALRQVAHQFESLFTSMMLKSMRQASGSDPMFGSDQADMYQDMYDQQLAVQLGKGKGIGLADMLVKQLMGGAAAATSAADGTPALDKQGGLGILKPTTSTISPTSNSSSAGSSTSANWPPQSREDFVNAIRPAATAAANELGIDPDTLIAHAALETGWGQSLPTGVDGRSSENLFGIKAGGNWQGATASTVTHEFTNGSMQPVSASFRAYDSPEDSIKDYVRLLKNSPRYASALGTGTDVAAFARGLVSGGYATDPAYVAKLTAVATRLKSGNSLPLTNTTAS